MSDYIRLTRDLYLKRIDTIFQRILNTPSSKSGILSRGLPYDLRELLLDLQKALQEEVETYSVEFTHPLKIAEALEALNNACDASYIQELENFQNAVNDDKRSCFTTQRIADCLIFGLIFGLALSPLAIAGITILMGASLFSLTAIPALISTLALAFYIIDDYTDKIEDVQSRATNLFHFFPKNPNHLSNVPTVYPQDDLAELTAMYATQ